MEKTGDKKSKLLQNSVITFFILCALVFVVNDQKANIYNVMNKFKLIPQPERFTELYFEDHAKLPKKVTVNVPISFAFTIHNLEGVDREYPYRIYYKNDYATTTIKNSSVFIKNNEYKTITDSYTFTSLNSQKTIFVELTDKHQGLHFSLTNINQ